MREVRAAAVGSIVMVDEMLMTLQARKTLEEIDNIRD
jgi:hypothetical protein